MRIVFAGTPLFARATLEKLLQDSHYEIVGVATQPDRAAGRGMMLTPSPVKALALAHGLDLITPQKLRDNADALEWLQNKQADFLVVVAFGLILPRPWLEAPKHGALNLHASLLPRWRGAAPIERAILAGDHATGVCLMQMEEGLDTGPVFARTFTPITTQTTGGQLHDQLCAEGGQMLVNTLPRIFAGQLQPEAQSKDGVLYAAKLGSPDRLIDWHCSALEIDRQVRAFAPQVGARTKFLGRWLKVLAGAPCDTLLTEPVGALVRHGSSLIVACGQQSSYRLELVQPEGKKAMNASAFANGLPVGEHHFASD